MKFRVWDSLDKVYLDCGWDFVIDESGRLCEVEGDGSLDRLNEQVLIVEYSTELLDIKGKEIYTGDIIHFTVENQSCYGGEKQGLVDFYHERIPTMPIIRLKNGIKHLGVGHLHAYLSPLIILGNIHQHPDLLKQK